MRLGIVGAGRGAVYRDASEVLGERVRVVAVCDEDTDRLADWRTAHPGVRLYDRFENFLGDSEVDAVYIATPMTLHATQSILALSAGKHVLSEIPAAVTLEEGSALLDAVRTSGRTYMMAENYCYIPECRLVRSLCQSGRFGRIVFAEGLYLHECRSLFWNEDGSLTWRGELKRAHPGNTYPTHSLGPICQWLGIGTFGLDRLRTVAAFRTPDESLQDFALRRWGPDHPASKKGFFNHGDRVTTVLTCESGATILLHLDTHSPRPPLKAGFSLQGTRGAFVSGRVAGEDGLVYFSDDPGTSQAKPAWRPLRDVDQTFFEREGLDPRLGALGRRSGDYLLLQEFLEAVTTGAEPPIGVRDAVAWSCVMPLSRRSIESGSIPVEFPDFVYERRKE